jgi:quercetin dioxygenase-like cupin family protein
MRNVSRAAPKPDAALDPAAIGAALRASRKAARLTMTALAARAGVTQSYISQVEAGMISPSLSTLYGLAQALGVAPTALLPSSSGGATLVRAGEGPAIAQSDQPGSPVARMLTGGGTQLEVTETVTPVGAVDDTTFAHPGEELLYVLAGRLEVTLDADPPVVLAKGDSLHFDAMRTHRFAAVGRQAARYLLVAAHPHA